MTLVACTEAAIRVVSGSVRGLVCRFTMRAQGTGSQALCTHTGGAMRCRLYVGRAAARYEGRVADNGTNPEATGLDPKT